MLTWGSDITLVVGWVFSETFIVIHESLIERAEPDSPLDKVQPQIAPMR